MTARGSMPAEAWAAVAAWLAAHGHQMDLAEPPTQLRGGLANLNFRVRLDGAPAVFRRPPAGPLAPGASDMAREAKALARLHPRFPLAPRLIAFCPDPGIIGVPFQLIEYRPGVAVGGSLPDAFPAASHRWMLPALLEALHRLHRLSPQAIGLGDLGRPEGFAARQLGGWTRRAAAAFADAPPGALAPLVARLEAQVPPDAAPRLLHMDPKFDNLLFDPHRRCATALIDWDMATQGPPAFDLAVLLSYWIEPADPGALHSLEAVPSLAPGWPDRRGVVAAHATIAGARPADLGWYLALARLRLATAWMQLYRLWERGALTGPRYRRFPTLAGAILAHALDRFGEEP